MNLPDKDDHIQVILLPCITCIQNQNLFKGDFMQNSDLEMLLSETKKKETEKSPRLTLQFPCTTKLMLPLAYQYRPLC